MDFWRLWYTEQQDPYRYYTTILLRSRKNSIYPKPPSIFWRLPGFIVTLRTFKNYDCALYLLQKVDVYVQKVQCWSLELFLIGYIYLTSNAMERSNKLFASLSNIEDQRLQYIIESWNKNFRQVSSWVIHSNNYPVSFITTVKIEQKF